jgi:hypothetical protein
VLVFFTSSESQASYLPVAIKLAAGVDRLIAEL